MLNREKMIKEVERVSTAIFKQKKSLSWLTRDVWQQMTSDQSFLERIAQQRDTKYLSSWNGNLSDVLTINASEKNYSVLAVDGSQIYPDHHIQGIECFLINTGCCYLSYGKHSKATLFSEPKVYVPDHFGLSNKHFSFTPELVDLVREEQEFVMLAGQVEKFFRNAHVLRDASLLRMSGELEGELSNPLVLRNPVTGVSKGSSELVPQLALFDGNLLFWHLESKPADLKEEFCDKYSASLYQLYQTKTLTAGYLSATRFKDLVELVNVGACEKQLNLFSQGSKFPICDMIDELTDAELLAHVLRPLQRTTVLKSNAKITQLYPDVLKPHFFYLNTGSEIVRIEIPAWIAVDQEKVNRICSICLDQVEKGYGYPVALAEAHAQAVVQSADKNFFYQFLQGVAMRQGKSIHFSQKSLKKRILTV